MIIVSKNKYLVGKDARVLEKGNQKWELIPFSECGKRKG